MRRKLKLRNQRQQHLATILYFFEEQLNHNIGIIISNDLTIKETWLYQNETIEEVIADLTKRINIEYHDYVEVKE